MLLSESLEKIYGMFQDKYYPVLVFVRIRRINRILIPSKKSGNGYDRISDPLDLLFCQRKICILIFHFMWKLLIETNCIKQHAVGRQKAATKYTKYKKLCSARMFSYLKTSGGDITWLSQKLPTKQRSMFLPRAASERLESWQRAAVSYTRQTEDNNPGYDQSINLNSSVH